MINDAARTVEVELAPSEQLLWSGAPRSGWLLRNYDWYQIPTSVLFTAFAVFWEAGILSTNAPLIFKLWGVPFLAVGAYFLVGRFIYDAALRARTSYGLTDQRALIVQRLIGRNVKTVTLRTVVDLNFSVGADGSGTITFGRPIPAWQSGPWSGWGYAPAPPAFEAIEDARRVYGLVRDAQMKAQKTF